MHDLTFQTVFYTTHQTFLTHRAVYLLVLDLTLPLEAPICTYRQGRHGQVLDKTCPQTVAGKKYFVCNPSMYVNNHLSMYR